MEPIVTVERTNDGNVILGQFRQGMIHRGAFLERRTAGSESGEQTYTASPATLPTGGGRDQAAWSGRGTLGHWLIRLMEKLQGGSGEDDGLERAPRYLERQHWACYTDGKAISTGLGPCSAMMEARRRGHRTPDNPRPVSRTEFTSITTAIGPHEIDDAAATLVDTLWLRNAMTPGERLPYHNRTAVGAVINDARPVERGFRFPDGSEILIQEVAGQRWMLYRAKPARQRQEA